MDVILRTLCAPILVRPLHETTANNMKQIDLREGALRQHRTVALFAVIQCWVRGLDGVCFQRDHLKRLVGVERFKGTRIDWLRRDLKDAFPHQRLLVFGGTSKFASYYVSR